MKSLAANLFDFGQVLGGIGSERFYAHTIPIVVTFPDICEPSGIKCDIALLCDVLREYARAWQDCLRSANAPEDANTLSPEVKHHVRSLQSLCRGIKLDVLVIIGLLT